MSDLAVAGQPPAFTPSSNVCDLIFSNPFEPGSELLKHAPTSQTKAHHIPRIPLQKPLFVNPATGAQISWQRTRQDALRIAAGLHALGLQPSPAPTPSPLPATPPPIVSPIVLVHIPNSLAFAPLLYGILASGLTATMANPALTEGELAWILQNSKPQAVVTSPDGWAVLRKAMDELSDRELKEALLSKGRIFVVDPANDDYGAALHSFKAPTSDVRDWKALLSSAPLKAPVAFAPEEWRLRTAVILWSSGTSGKSKGVLLSHQALNAALAGAWHINLGFNAEERWLGFVPFFHVFGLLNVLLLAPCCGATTLIMPKFDPRRVLAYVQEYRVTFLHMAPPVAVLLAKSDMLDDFDVTSVRGGVSGGAPLAPEVIEQVYKRLGILIKLGYGMSEAGSVCNQVGDTWEDLKPQLGSTGVPMYGVELKIISTDGSAKTVKNGQEGEIMIRSPCLMSCYLNNKTATDEAFGKDGWLHTGDIGKIDEKGYLWITDRLKEVIKVKGFQVSPSELEGVLCGSPLIADAGVTSVFDAAQATEFPRAYIVPADAKLLAQFATGKAEATPELKRLGDEVRRLVESKTTNYKWLRGNVVFVQQIPKSPTGKILRRLLKDAKGVEVRIYAQRERPVKAKL